MNKLLQKLQNLFNGTITDDQVDVEQVLKALNLSDAPDIVNAEDLSDIISALGNRTDMTMLPLYYRIRAKGVKEARLMEKTWREKFLLRPTSYPSLLFAPDDEPNSGSSNYGPKRRNTCSSLGLKVGTGIHTQREAKNSGISDLLDEQVVDASIDIVKGTDWQYWNGHLNDSGPIYQMRGLKPSLLNSPNSIDVNDVLTQEPLDEMINDIIDQGANPSGIYCSHASLASKIAGFAPANITVQKDLGLDPTQVTGGVAAAYYVSNASRKVRIPILVASNMAVNVSGAAETEGFVACLDESHLWADDFFPLMKIEAASVKLAKNVYVLWTGTIEDRLCDSSTNSAHGMLYGLTLGS
jgi:hypothetical protein